MYILSQVLIGIADILYVGSMLQKRKLGLISFLFISDILVALHYLCLDALTGSIIIFIDATFLLVSFLLAKFKKDKYNFWAVITAITAVIVTTILTWVGPISLLPMFAIVTYLIGMIFKNVIFAKFGAMLRNLLNIFTWQC